jgi:hypothetical protein
MDVQFNGQHHSFRALELLEGHPEAGQTLDAPEVIVCGFQVKALPHLAELMAPLPHGVHGDCQATYVLEGQG